jgi:hypothetical protein
VAVTALSRNGNALATSAATARITAPASPPPRSTQQNGRFGFAAGGNIQNLSTTDLARYRSQMAQTTPSARSLMLGRGDGAQQIWAREFGAPTGTTTRDVSEASQAKLVTDSYTQLKSWSWAGPGLFYSYHDNGTNTTDVEQNFGIVHYDWTPKLAYTAYQAAAVAG